MLLGEPHRVSEPGQFAGKSGRERAPVVPSRYFEIGSVHSGRRRDVVDPADLTFGLAVINADNDGPRAGGVAMVAQQLKWVYPTKRCLVPTERLGHCAGPVAQGRFATPAMSRKVGYTSG